MGSFVLEDGCELIGLELGAQVLGQHHSPIPAGQGEREQAPTGHGLDGSSGHLGVGGLPAEETSRLRVLTATAPAVQSAAQEEPERDEQGQEQEEDDGDERFDLRTAEGAGRDEAALADIADGHRQHIGPLEQPCRHEAEGGDHGPGQQGQGQEGDHGQARHPHEHRRGRADEGGAGPGEDDGKGGDARAADQQAHPETSFSSR